MKLRCTNAACPTRTSSQNPMFDINLAVDENGDPCEQTNKIDGEYFTCCECCESAEWVQNDIEAFEEEP